MEISRQPMTHRSSIYTGEHAAEAFILQSYSYYIIFIASLEFIYP
jgi:hypothetical protein